MGKKTKGKGKSKKKSKKGDGPSVVQLTDEEFRFLILALQVESKSQAVGFYKNWCKEQSIDLKILNQKAGITRKRHNHHLRNLDAQSELFEASYGPYVFVHPTIPEIDPPPPPAAVDSEPTSSVFLTRPDIRAGGRLSGTNATGNSTITAGATGSAGASASAATAGGTVRMAPSVASSTNSAAANGKPSALAMRRQSFKSIAAATIAANKLVESVAPPHWLASVASQIADGIGPGVPVAVASAKRYDGASLAARDLPAPRVPRLSADPRIARCVTLVKAVESDRNALLQQLARADAELDRLTDETDPELLNDLVTEIALVQQQIDATNARLAQNSSHIRDRHAQSLQQTEAQTNEQIQSVNQRATENQIKRMTPLNRAIVDKHARIMREVMSVRAQESALLAELMAAESRLSEIKRQLRHWTDKCDLLPDTLTGTTAPSLLSLPGPQNQRSGSPSLGAAGLVVRAKTLASSSSSRPTTTATTDSNCGRHRSWDNNNEPPIHVPERLPPLSDRYFVGRPPPPPLPLPVQSTTENKAE